MFNDNFFPTPEPIIEKMLTPYIEKHGRYACLPADRVILEPSAGKGDILDHITNNLTNRRVDKDNLYCMEKEPELQYILREKGYRLIGTDFLQYSGEHQFNLILMNPPFSNGDEHLLKAWEIMEEGDICCLLNMETIRNPYTERRQLIRKILKDHGKVINLGQAFRQAERKTDIEVAMIQLRKEAKNSRFAFNFKKVTSEEHGELNEETVKNEVATRDIVGNMIRQFQQVKDAYISWLKASSAVDFYLNGLTNPELSKWDLIRQEGRATNQQKYNGFCDRVRESIWRDILGKLNVEKYMTHQVRSDFFRFAQTQGMLDFTKENVQELINLIFDNRELILDRAVGEVFDLFTKYHKENRQYVEGWKNNEKWKVNKKVILPNWVRMSWDKPAERMRYGAEYRVNWSYQSEYSDIDKVMCYLTATRYEDCYTIYQALEQEFQRIGKIYKGPATGKAESQFFRCTFFLKGTLHLEFKDDTLWQEFNMRACAGKKWLPEQEEKAWKGQRTGGTKEESRLPVLFVEQ